MENNFDNTPNENEQPVYTDPNADVKEDVNTGTNQYQYTQSTPESDAESRQQTTYAGYQQNSYQNSNYQQYQSSQNYQNDNSQQQYQDNLNYNIGNNMSYNQNNYQGLDTSPMSMGDWILTLLAAMIPCAGIILYLVWAFSSTGNINRRNFCRAQLIIIAVVFVLYIIMFAVFGAALLGSM